MPWNNTRRDERAATCRMGLDMRGSLCMDLRTLLQQRESGYPRSRRQTRGHVNVTNAAGVIPVTVDTFPYHVFSLLVLTDGLITRWSRSQCWRCVWVRLPRALAWKNFAALRGTPATRRLLHRDTRILARGWVHYSMINPILLNISCPRQTMPQQSTLTSESVSTPPSEQPSATVYHIVCAFNFRFSDVQLIILFRSMSVNEQPTKRRRVAPDNHRKRQNVRKCRRFHQETRTCPVPCKVPWYVT